MHRFFSFHLTLFLDFQVFTSVFFFFLNTFSSFSHGVCTAEISRFQLLQAFWMGKGKWGGPEGEGAPRHPVSFSPLFSGPPITILSPICHQHHHTVAHTDSTVDRQDSFRFRAACKLVFLVFVFFCLFLSFKTAITASHITVALHTCIPRLWSLVFILN